MALAEALCCAVGREWRNVLHKRQTPLPYRPAPIRSAMFGHNYTSIKWQVTRFILGILVGWTIAGYLYH